MTLPRLEPMLSGTKVIPVLVLDDPKTAADLARALVAGGLPALEVTLRAPKALACAEAMAQVPGAFVGLGTLTRPEHFAQARDAGARFVVSPGLTDRLADAALQAGLPYLPGTATVTEAMIALEHGFTELKFFPASLSGGPAALKGMAPLLPDARFCPTGGVRDDTLRDYLSLPNVFAAGGTWLAPADAVARGRWDEVERLAREAVSLASGA